MNCQNFESIVNDLVRTRMMDASAREQAQLHSSGCASCAARLQDEQALTLGLRELAVSMREENASFESEAKVAVAFRDHHARLNSIGNASTSLASVGLVQGSRRYWNYAAAAGILLAVGLGITASRFWRWENSAGPVTQTTANVPLAQTLEHAPLVKVPGPESAVKRVKPAPRSRSSKQASASGTRLAKHTGRTRNTVTVQSLNILAPAVEVTTEFIPIGYSNAANVQEGGQVVRLEMPRYAMARFGVPINEERYAEMVKADVWVGADGLARAIRFVQ